MEPIYWEGTGRIYAAYIRRVVQDEISQESPRWGELSLVASVALAVIFNLSSGIIALLVSYYAFQTRRIIESSVLSALSIGFMLLGAALLAEVVTTLSLGLTAAGISRFRTFELLENLAYLILQVVALLIIAIGYARATYGRKGVSLGALPSIATYAVKAAARSSRLTGLALLLFYLFLGLEFVILLILVFIMFQGLLIYSKSRENSSLLVLLAFALIFVGHVVVLRSILEISGAEYLVAAAVQFLGFLLLLAFVIRSGRVGSA